MIVTCSNCDTSFQLDESRVPAQGIRVRCSRCKQSFFLPHPAASRAEAVDAVAQQAVRGRSAKTPDATQDLPRAHEVRKAAAAKTGKAAPHPEEVDNEDEWVFNRDLPAEDKTQAASETDLSADASTFENAAAAGADVETREESVFGSVDDYSSLVGEEQPPDALAEDAAGREALVGRAAGKPSRAGASVQSDGDDLGDPESWDFTTDTADASAEGAGARSAAGTGIGRIGPVSKPSLATPAAGFDESDYAEGEETTAVAVWTGRFAQAAGWGTTLLLVGMAVASGFGPGSQRLVHTHPALELAPLRVEAIEAGWLETARSGRLFLVSAELRNASEQAAPARGLEVALLDSQGQPLVAIAPALAGLALAEADLRELATPELLAEQQRAARALAVSVLGPGESLLVQAFFPALPEAASRYRLRPSDQSPGPAAMPEPGREPEAGVPVEGPPSAAEPQADPLLDL